MASLGWLGLHPLDNWWRGALKVSKQEREGDVVRFTFWKCHSGSCVVFGMRMIKTRGKMRTFLLTLHTLKHHFMVCICPYIQSHII